MDCTSGGEGLSSHYEWDGGGQDVSLAGRIYANTCLVWPRKPTQWSFAWVLNGLPPSNSFREPPRKQQIPMQFCFTLNRSRSEKFTKTPQVFKMGLTRTALEADQQHRYFTVFLALTRPFDDCLVYLRRLETSNSRLFMVRNSL